MAAILSRPGVNAQVIFVIIVKGNVSCLPGAEPVPKEPNDHLLSIELREKILR